MSKNNPPKENEVPTNENNEKITFEEYINEIIINSKNKEEQIKKEDLLKEIEERVENGNDSKIKEKIDSIFLNEESLKKIEIEEKLKNINEESPKKETLMDIIKFSDKKVSKDLDFLSEDLPEDKNREKILTHTNFSLTEINTNKNIEDENEKNKESTFNITKIESVIKPVNGFDDVQKNEKDNNEKEKKPKPKEINKPIYNPNEFSNKKSSLLLTTNTLKNNIVLPTNENKNINLKENNENLNNNFNNNKNNSDYFLSIYKTYAPNNKIMKTLDEKINKVSTKPIRQNNILSFSKGINTLNDFKINNKPFNNTKKKNSFLDKIEQEQKSIMNSGIKKSSLHQYKPKQYDLKNSNEKKAYVENVKNELMEFSKNIDKQKQSRDKNSGFDEINQKLDELYKKNKESKIVKSEETNNVNEENKIENEEKKESQ
jgi:hypothetical protein